MISKNKLFKLLLQKYIKTTPLTEDNAGASSAILTLAGLLRFDVDFFNGLSSVSNLPANINVYGLFEFVSTKKLKKLLSITSSQYRAYDNYGDNFSNSALSMLTEIAKDCKIHQ